MRRPLKPSAGMTGVWHTRIHGLDAAPHNGLVLLIVVAVVAHPGRLGNELRRSMKVVQQGLDPAFLTLRVFLRWIRGAARVCEKNLAAGWQPQTQPFTVLRPATRK